ncbi:MAG: hypothetical protein RSA54_04350, partial [Glutamicibacter sp.]
MSRRTMLRSLMVAAAVVPLAACSGKEDALTAQANSGDGKNYIATNAKAIEELLDCVKICDPAIGSGAFP